MSAETSIKRAAHQLCARDPVAGQQTQCSGKVRFETWSEAKSVAKRYKSDRARVTDRREPYQCRRCGGIHLGQVDRRVRQRNRRPHTRNGLELAR